MHNSNSLPDAGYVRLRAILRVIPVGKTTWWKGVRSGRFPQPFKPFGPRITCWRVDDIRALVTNPANEVCTK